MPSVAVLGPPIATIPAATNATYSARLLIRQCDTDSANLLPILKNWYAARIHGRWHGVVDIRFACRDSETRARTRRLLLQERRWRLNSLQDCSRDSYSRCRKSAALPVFITPGGKCTPLINRTVREDSGAWSLLKNAPVRAKRHGEFIRGDGGAKVSRQRCRERPAVHTPPECAQVGQPQRSPSCWTAPPWLRLAPAFERQLASGFPWPAGVPVEEYSSRPLPPLVPPPLQAAKFNTQRDRKAQANEKALANAGPDHAS